MSLRPAQELASSYHKMEFKKEKKRITNPQSINLLQVSMLAVKDETVNSVGPPVKASEPKSKTIKPKAWSVIIQTYKHKNTRDLTLRNQHTNQVLTVSRKSVMIRDIVKKVLDIAAETVHLVDRHEAVHTHAIALVADVVTPVVPGQCRAGISRADGLNVAVFSEPTKKQVKSTFRPTRI